MNSMPSTSKTWLAACAIALGLSACASTPDSAPPPVEKAQSRADTETPGADVYTVETTDKPELDIKTIEFEIEIAAPVEKVWDIMLSIEGYKQWTSPFMAGSYFKGSWSEGERMQFLAPGANGMVAEIATVRRHEFVSIKHLGYVVNGVEDTTSVGVRSWAPAYENYRFRQVAGGTVVSVEQDVFAGMEAYMSHTWQLALASLKSLCEAD